MRCAMHVSSACMLCVVEVICRGCLWCLLFGCSASGDIAATGACAVWLAGLHGGTKTLCCVFTMLVALGLDGSLVSREVRIAAAAASMVGPLFPPKCNGSAKKQRVGGRAETTGAELMSEWREYIARHLWLPRENAKLSNSSGYKLAVRIRKGKASGIFTDAELTELAVAAYAHNWRKIPRGRGGRRRSTPKQAVAGGVVDDVRRKAFLDTLHPDTQQVVCRIWQDAESIHF